MRVQLNRKLKLMVPYRTRDDSGGYETTWTMLGEIWASVEAGTGRDAELAGLSISTIPYKITVRAAPFGAPSRPVPGQQMRDGERIFQILAVTEAVAMGCYITCFAREEEVAS
ncbi:MAG: head-tail adaptor protein [Rhodobacteraceae bacterium]|nr:head-tail adaptor protein [Paracoccaceae bacterium]